MLTQPINPAAAWPAGISYIQSGDGLGTFYHQAAAKPISDAFGYLKTQADKLLVRLDGSVSGTATRFLAGHAFDGNAPSGTWVYSLNGGAWAEFGTGTPAGQLIYPVSACELPHGATLQKIVAYLKGGAGHAAMPATKPSIKGWFTAIASETTAQLGATVTDGSTTTVAFESLHTITIPSINHEVDRGENTYSVEVIGEAGANYAQGLQVIGIAVFYDPP